MVRSGTPLHAACLNGDLEMTKLLASRNADLSARETVRILFIVAFIYCSCCFSLFFLLFLSSHKFNQSDLTPFHMACYSAKKEIVAYFLEKHPECVEYRVQVLSPLSSLSILE